MKSFTGKLLFLFFLFYAFAISNIFSQVIITIHIPPPNQLRIEDLWRLDLYNSTGKALKIYLAGSVKEEKAGLMIDAKSSAFDLPTGISSKNANSFSSGDVHFLNDNFRQAILRTGNAPDGIYTICIEARSYPDEKMIGSLTCIQQSVKNNTSQTITIIRPGNGDSVDFSKPVEFMWERPNITEQNFTYSLKIVRSNVPLSEEQFKYMSAVYEKSNIRGSTFLILPPHSFDSTGTYYYKVWASGSNNEILASSNINVFAPRKPNELNCSQNKGKEQNFITMSGPDDGSNVDITHELPTFSCYWRDVGTYHWNVMAVTFFNQGQPSAWQPMELCSNYPEGTDLSSYSFKLAGGKSKQDALNALNSQGAFETFLTSSGHKDINNWYDDFGQLDYNNLNDPKKPQLNNGEVYAWQMILHPKAGPNDHNIYPDVAGPIWSFTARIGDWAEISVAPNVLSAPTDILNVSWKIHNFSYQGHEYQINSTINDGKGHTVYLSWPNHSNYIKSATGTISVEQIINDIGGACGNGVEDQSLSIETFNNVTISDTVHVKINEYQCPPSIGLGYLNPPSGGLSCDFDTKGLYNYSCKLNTNPGETIAFIWDCKPMNGNNDFVEDLKITGTDGTYKDKLPLKALISQFSPAPKMNTTYTFTATDGVNHLTNTITVNVIVKQVPPPSVISFSATSESKIDPADHPYITFGNSTTFSWNVTPANCTVILVGTDRSIQNQGKILFQRTFVNASVYSFKFTPDINQLNTQWTLTATNISGTVISKPIILSVYVPQHPPCGDSGKYYWVRLEKDGDPGFKADVSAWGCSEDEAKTNANNLYCDGKCTASTDLNPPCEPIPYYFRKLNADSVCQGVTWGFGCNQKEAEESIQVTAGIHLEPCADPKENCGCSP